MKITGNMAVFIALLTAAGLYAGEADFANYFTDNMVLQRDVKCPVWGYGDADTKVELLRNGESLGKTQVNAAGYWRIDVAPQTMGGPYELTVKSDDKSVSIKNVMFGDVYLCSGQSNMEFPLRMAEHADELIAGSNIANLRLLQIKNDWSGYEQTKFDGSWQVSSPAVTPNFSAIAYIAGKTLAQDLDIPIGLVQSDWGGTPIEAWMSMPAITANKDITGYAATVVQYYDKNGEPYKALLAKNIELFDNYAASLKSARDNGTIPYGPPAFSIELQRPTDMAQPAVHYNSMINPLVPAAFKGVFWYQGCANVGWTHNYDKLLSILSTDWRKNFETPDLPFIVIQIAPYDYETTYNQNPKNENFEMIVFGQQKFCDADPNAHLVVTNDVGNIKDIHPTKKIPVGERVANLCKKYFYGQNELPADSPVLDKVTNQGNELVVSFRNAEGGLQTADNAAPTTFLVAGADGIFIPAEAKIVGETVVLSHPKIAKPLAAKFAWSDKAEPNLRNQAGLPAASFKTDVPEGVSLYDLVPQAADFKVIYQAVPTNLPQAEKLDAMKYEVNNSAQYAGKKIKRVGYFMELVKPDLSRDYVFVAMKPFTDDITKLGVPTLNTKAVFQQNVGEIEVFSNVPNLRTGKFAEGAIEFWPYAFDTPRKMSIADASDKLYDWDDTPQLTSGLMYGSMQIHNLTPPQSEVVMAFNKFHFGENAEYGIGTNTGLGHPDYVYAENGKNYRQATIIVAAEFEEE